MSKQDSSSSEELQPDTKALMEKYNMPLEVALAWQKRQDQYQKEYGEDLIKLFKLDVDESESESSKAAS